MGLSGQGARRAALTRASATASPFSAFRCVSTVLAAVVFLCRSSADESAVLRPQEGSPTMRLAPSSRQLTSPKPFHLSGEINAHRRRPLPAAASGPSFSASKRFCCTRPLWAAVRMGGGGRAPRRLLTVPAFVGGRRHPAQHGRVQARADEGAGRAGAAHVVGHLPAPSQQPPNNLPKQPSLLRHQRRLI